MSSSEFARTDVVAPAVNQPVVVVTHPAAVADTAPVNTVQRVRWNPLTRIAFRFTAVYLFLYCLAITQVYYGIFGPILRWLPQWASFPAPQFWSPVQKMANHIAKNWWGYAEPSKGWFQGGGDKPFDWALTYGVLLIATALAVAWSAVDWKRPSYVRLHAWFRLFLRLAVAAQMVSYGYSKAFPMQMPFPSPTQLLTPYGNYGLMRILWLQVGSSPSYEIFTGLVELLAGILLLIPGCTLIGALVGVAATSQVFILNMTFDVPVKNLSMHLFIMCVVLLIPDLRRLVNVLVLRRPTDMHRDDRLFTNRTAQRVAVGLQLFLASWMVVWGQSGVFARMKNWEQYPPRQTRNLPLYGIWAVEKVTIDGVERAPLLNDYDRWRRVIVERPNSITLQRMNDSFNFQPARIDGSAKTIKFTNDVPNPFAPPNAPKPPLQERGDMTFQQPSPDLLIMDGTFDGKRMHVEAKNVPLDRYLLMRAKFRWVQ